MMNFCHSFGFIQQTQIVSLLHELDDWWIVVASKTDSVERKYVKSYFWFRKEDELFGAALQVVSLEIHLNFIVEICQSLGIIKSEKDGGLESCLIWQELSSHLKPQPHEIMFSWRFSVCRWQTGQKTWFWSSNSITVSMLRSYSSFCQLSQLSKISFKMISWSSMSLSISWASSLRTISLISCCAFVYVYECFGGKNKVRQNNPNGTIFPTFLSMGMFLAVEKALARDSFILLRHLWIVDIGLIMWKLQSSP